MMLGQQQSAHDRRVDQYAESEPDAEFLQSRDVTEDQSTESRRP